MTIEAWGVQYEWYPADSSFSSNNATLDAVWNLSVATLQDGVLDTYTDSNTRVHPITLFAFPSCHAASFFEGVVTPTFNTASVLAPPTARSLFELS